MIALVQFKSLWMTQMSGLLISSQLIFGCPHRQGRFQFVSSSVSYHLRLAVKQPTAGSRLCCCLRLQYGLVKVVTQIRSLGLGLHYHGLRTLVALSAVVALKGWVAAIYSSSDFKGLVHDGWKSVTLRHQHTNLHRFSQTCQCIHLWMPNLALPPPLAHALATFLCDW